MGRAAYHVTRRPDGRAETVNKLLTGSSCQRPRQRPSTVNCGALLLPADDDALARWLDDLEARVGRQRPHKRVAPRRRWRRRGRCDRDRAVVSVRSRRHPIPAPARSAAFVRTGTHGPLGLAKLKTFDWCAPRSAARSDGAERAARTRMGKTPLRRGLRSRRRVILLHPRKRPRLPFSVNLP
jgi:hypothetical protein